MKKFRFHISIPTLNSAQTLDLAIKSVLKQKYSNYTLNIVDSFSSDGTQEIAKKHNIPLEMYEGKLLGARYLGFVGQDCDYAIFMDSDQVLEETMLDRLNDMLQEDAVDMVILEEHSYQKRTWVEKMYDRDRTNVQEEYDYNVQPDRGVLLPRVFKKTVLNEAFNNIDRDLYPTVVAHDHAIIYFECSKISTRISYLKKAIYHQELKGLLETFFHFVSYGRNSREFRKMNLYIDLIDKKMGGRNSGFIREITWSKLYTAPLLLTKAAGYYWGYWISKKVQDRKNVNQK